jgi:hypothetical protein
MSTLWRGDMDAVFGRAKALWVPRWRDSFLRQDRLFDRPAKGLLSPSHTDPSSNRSRPLGVSTDLHDGAKLRSKFILANSGNRDEKEEVLLDVNRVEDVLNEGLNLRNHSVSSLGTFGKSQQVSSHVPVVGEKVMAWGIVGKKDDDDEFGEADLSSSIIVDQGENVASWYEATLLSIGRSGCEVSFSQDNVIPAVSGKKLPVHLISKIVPDVAASDSDSSELFNYDDNDFEDDFVDSSANLAPIIIDEVPLPELRVPGNVLHLWSQRGVFRVSHVECDDRVLTNFKL